MGILAQIALAVSLALTLSPFSAILPSSPADVVSGSKKCNPNDHNAYTGYNWKADPNVCVPGMVTMETWFLPAPPYSYGAAVFYAPHVMEGTARYRELPLEGYLDGVSLMSPSDIGRTVWLRRPGHEWEGPYLVVDSAARQDIYPVITSRGEIVEVGFTTAERWGMTKLGHWEGGIHHRQYTVYQWRMAGVEVLKMDELPEWASMGTVEPIYFPDWWVSWAQFSNGPARDVAMARSLKPDHPKFPGWIWRDGWIEMNAKDDWYSFLFPYSNFDFDIPDDELYYDEICSMLEFNHRCPDQYRVWKRLGGPIP